MLRPMFLAAVSATVLLLAPSSRVIAAPPVRPCAKGCEAMRNMRGPAFEPKTVETLEGEIVDVTRMEHGKGIVGVHIMLKTDKESVEVHLGPACFVDNLDLKVAKGDRATVKGSRVKTMRGPAVLTQEITTNGKTTTLRTADGAPAWGMCQ